MKFPMSFWLTVFILLLNRAEVKAEAAKPYVFAPWLSDEENKSNAENFSTLGTTVKIDMRESNPADGQWFGLRYFAAATKRYQQATRFVVVYHWEWTDAQGYERWIYDRNQQAVYLQSSQDGETNWNGFCVTEPVGVTDEMFQEAALKRSNTVLDLVKYGAINRRLFWKNHWITISKSDPRVAMARHKFLASKLGETPDEDEN